MAQSEKNTLTRADFDQWTKETLIYNVMPLFLVFLTSLNNSFAERHMLPGINDFLVAANAMYGATLAMFIAAMTNLLGKYKSGA